MTRVLLIDNDDAHAGEVSAAFARRGLITIRVSNHVEAINKGLLSAHVCEIVVLVMTDLSHPWLTILSSLQDATQQGSFMELPLFLCVSKRELAADFQLRIERMGARYACEE